MKEFRASLSGGYINNSTIQQNQSTSKDKIHIKRVMNSEKVINAKKTRLLSEEQASFIITKTFRENIAQKSYSRMFSEGNYWKRKMDEPNGFASMKKLSADNISKLVKSLGSLDDNEIRFFEKILSLKFAITHATDANVINNNTLTLFSRKKLDERNISYRSGLSTARDIEEFKNDDFVFFSIEPGDGGFKHNSRFGRTVYAVDFDNPSLSQVAWVSLQEQLMCDCENTRKHIRGISEESHKILSYTRLGIRSSMFLAKDFRKGLALSLIKRFRELPEHDRQTLLSNLHLKYLNDVINGIYRPEVKVPRHFFINHGENNIKISCGDGIALSISERDDYQAVHIAVHWNYKALYFASDRLKKDLSIIKRALSSSPDAVNFIHDQLTSDIEYAKEVIRICPMSLKYFPESLIDNEEIINHAVKQDKSVLQFASERLQKKIYHRFD
ncbi:TPA: DUF4116 domain-containing protein [Vibrio parahaemolyticus]|uniref:DUF4116 domain-containing protein n=1 Tax=Vibrio parahaemolyticus TaxID=670 RepID=UPI0009B59593|nr:DUF4116 domain-containing protein [Vibrio parahaemolyticus]TXM30275.1 DUF4116 domain-containing protein [Vibrio parahaemolyticus]